MNSNIINIMYDYTYLQRSIQMRLVDKKPYKDIVAELKGPIRSTIGKEYFYLWYLKYRV